MVKAVIAGPVFLVREGFKRVVENIKDVAIKGEITKGTEFWTKLKLLRLNINNKFHNSKIFLNWQAIDDQYYLIIVLIFMMEIFIKFVLPKSQHKKYFNGYF